MTAAWILFYDDGSVVTSEDCAPEDVPGYGLMCGAQKDTRDLPGVTNVSWITFAGDYVYFSKPDGLWRPAQTFADMEDLILHRKPISPWYCKGRTVPDEVFWPIWNECRRWASEQGLPEKAGFAPGERVPKR